MKTDNFTSFGLQNDFPVFNEYTVKQRKRISKKQKDILENQYRISSKPNSQKRIELSEKLAMTPREVQVWFQNRRAKDKKFSKSLTQSSDKNESFDFDKTIFTPMKNNDDILSMIINPSSYEQKETNNQQNVCNLENIEQDSFNWMDDINLYGKYESLRNELVDHDSDNIFA